MSWRTRTRDAWMAGGETQATDLADTCPAVVKLSDEFDERGRSRHYK